MATHPLALCRWIALRFRLRRCAGPAGFDRVLDGLQERRGGRRAVDLQKSSSSGQHTFVG